VQPFVAEGGHEPLKDLRESLDQIRLQVDRCGGITQAILKFGRQSEPKIGEVDLAKVIGETAAMVANRMHVNGIDYEQEIDAAIPGIASDPAQLQQVFLNLLNNAVDAVVERHGGSGGRIRVVARPTEEGMAEIRVEDDGTGIAEENMKKVFAPFFTTKPVGKGSGLGLSVCCGIVERLGGSMALENRRNEGTVFLLTFPAVKKDRPAFPRASSPGPPLPAVPNGRMKTT
jgi:two-component system NtrC family sensor kinase